MHTLFIRTDSNTALTCQLFVLRECSSQQRSVVQATSQITKTEPGTQLSVTNLQPVHITQEVSDAHPDTAPKLSQICKVQTIKLYCNYRHYESQEFEATENKRPLQAACSTTFTYHLFM